MRNLPPTRRFQDLLVWQKAHALVLSIYKYTMNFPDSERYGLTSQLRRASVSVPGNIVEGYKRRGMADKIRFLNISQASLEEAHYYLLLSQDLGYANPKGITLQLDEVSKLLEAYIKSIERKNFI